MKSVLKIIITFFASGMLFELLCSGIEYAISRHLKIKIMLLDIIKENFITVLIIYIATCFLLIIIQFFYNYLIVKKLNKKLEKIKKRGGDTNEK